MSDDKCNDCEMRDQCNDGMVDVSTERFTIPEHVQVFMADNAVAKAVAFTIAHQCEDDPSRMISSIFAMLAELHNNTEFNMEIGLKALDALREHVEKTQATMEAQGATKQ